MPTTTKTSTTTWAQVQRWNMSHTWKILRNQPLARRCRACGDHQGSVVRRCPGDH